MRLKKGKYELATIKKATDITQKGHLRAMEKCHPQMYEYELEAELLYEFTRQGAREMAFESIVAGGTNACTLHYSKNNQKLASGELVLIDAGAKFEQYSADISRTFPVSGKFTKKQQLIYEIVLRAQKEVIQKIKPGISWDVLQTTAEYAITSGLIEAKILKGKIDTIIEQKAYKPYFMHKIGHWLGLDTHDVGEYRLNKVWRTLEEGMVLTIEPGIYISPQLNNNHYKKKGIGIRIEDNILVTKNGYEILTSDLPKTVKGIERAMKK